MEWRNWSGLASARPTRGLRPAHDRRRRGRRGARREPRVRTVKMVGTGHSFTAIAAPEHTMLLPDRS